MIEWVVFGIVCIGIVVFGCSCFNRLVEIDTAPVLATLRRRRFGDWRRPSLRSDGDLSKMEKDGEAES